MKLEVCLILLLTIIIIGAAVVSFSGCEEDNCEDCDCKKCDKNNDDGDDDDDDSIGDDDSNPPDWFDQEASQFDNCVAYYTYFYQCYGVDIDAASIETTCIGFQDWEDTWSEDQCMVAAIDDYWECLLALSCDDYETYQEFNAEQNNCHENYAAAVVECQNGDDDDDDDDDDDYTGAAPLIAGAYWNPDPVVYDVTNDYWISTIHFTVCDPQNNLIGGAIYVYRTGTQTLIWANPVYWAAFTGLPDASNCSAPLNISLGTIFAQGATPPGWAENLCTDMEVTDAIGAWSNKLVNFCVYVP